MDELKNSLKHSHKQYMVDSLRHLVDYCRSLEQECNGSGLDALKEIAESSMNKKTYDSVKMAIENLDKPYNIILV